MKTLEQTGKEFYERYLEKHMTVKQVAWSSHKDIIARIAKLYPRDEDLNSVIHQVAAMVMAYARHTTGYVGAHKWVATIQVVYTANDFDDACDWVSGLFETAANAGPCDWQYAMFGFHRMYPTEYPGTCWWEEESDDSTD